MDKEQSAKNIRHLLHLGLIALSIFGAMLICALLGYRVVRYNGAETPSEFYHAARESTLPTTHDKAFPNLPQSDTTQASLPKQDVQIVIDKNDYLVLATNGIVELYTITPQGEKVYQKDLPISPDALLEADRILLEQGIILKSEEDLVALLEDYTS